MADFINLQQKNIDTQQKALDFLKQGLDECKETIALTRFVNNVLDTEGNISPYPQKYYNLPLTPVQISNNIIKPPDKSNKLFGNSLSNIINNSKFCMSINHAPYS